MVLVGGAGVDGGLYGGDRKFVLSEAGFSTEAGLIQPRPASAYFLFFLGAFREPLALEEDGLLLLLLLSSSFSFFVGVLGFFFFVFFLFCGVVFSSPPSSGGAARFFAFSGFKFSSADRACKSSSLNTNVVPDTIASTALSSITLSKCVAWCASKQRATTLAPASKQPWIPAPPAGVPWKTQRGRPPPNNTLSTSRGRYRGGTTGLLGPKPACRAFAS
jgi:hypothetical protein